MKVINTGFRTFFGNQRLKSWHLQNTHQYLIRPCFLINAHLVLECDPRL